MLKKIKEKIIHKLGGMTEDECRQYVACLEYNDIKSIKAEKDGKVVAEYRDKSTTAAPEKK